MADQKDDRGPVEYVNIAAVNVNPEEVVLRFYRQGINSDSPEPVVTLVMSHSHLMRFMDVVEKQKSAYEAIFGKIPLTPFEKMTSEDVKKLIDEGKILPLGDTNASTSNT